MGAGWHGCALDKNDVVLEPNSLIGIDYVIEPHHLRLNFVKHSRSLSIHTQYESQKDDFFNYPLHPVSNKTSL